MKKGVYSFKGKVKDLLEDLKEKLKKNEEI